ncbi:MAG: glycosyltransferase family 4 protein [Candidatus Sumerlaeaceae bacterium]|nr:glycosyltransferase family 4 protein [Candidatus Sumerlaeaceae bacterium]
MADILFLCDTYAPSLGGSETSLLNAVRGTVASGHHVIVFTPASLLGAEAERAFDTGEPYKVVRSRLWRRLFDLGGSKSAIVNRLARAAIVILLFLRGARIKPVDVIVAGHPVPLGNVALALKRLRGKPIIIITHGEDVTMFSRTTRMRSMLATALAGADVVTCSTVDSAKEIARVAMFAAEQTVVWPPALDAAGAEVAAEKVEEVRQRHGLAGRRVLLTVGRLVPRKGVDTTLRALASLAEEFPELVYLVVGTGPYDKDLKSLAVKLGIIERVVFAGSVDDTRPYYHAADVFVMPNRMMPDGEREGYGIVFVEAGLAGKPVIGGRSGGAQEAVKEGETGLLVNPESPNEVAAAIRRLLTEPGLAGKLGDEGRRHALELTAPEAQRARFDALISKALGK